MIFVECDPDVALVEALEVTSRNYTHSGNIGRVCRDVMRTENSKGMVDEDVAGTHPSYMTNLIELGRKDDIKLLKDQSENKYLIVLCPKLEDWILKSAAEAKVDMAAFNLPNDADQLHRIINIRIRNFKKLLIELKSKSNRLKKLQAILSDVNPTI
jgi:hypothetical protein